MEKFLGYVSIVENNHIVLLREKEVVQWLFGDLSFLPTIEKKNKTADEAQYKKLEDKLGQDMLACVFVEWSRHAFGLFILLFCF